MAEGKAPTGAGRKPKMKPGERSKPNASFETAREYLMAVMNDARIEAHRRDRAALALASLDRKPEVAKASGEPPTKRAQAAEAAKAAAGGKFAPRQPPRLVVSNK